MPASDSPRADPCVPCPLGRRQSGLNRASQTTGGGGEGSLISWSWTRLSRDLASQRVSFLRPHLSESGRNTGSQDTCPKTPHPHHPASRPPPPDVIETRPSGIKSCWFGLFLPGARSEERSGKPRRSSARGGDAAPGAAPRRVSAGALLCPGTRDMGPRLEPAGVVTAEGMSPLICRSPPSPTPRSQPGGHRGPGCDRAASTEAPSWW